MSHQEHEAPNELTEEQLLELNTMIEKTGRYPNSNDIDELKIHMGITEEDSSIISSLSETMQRLFEIYTFINSEYERVKEGYDINLRKLEGPIDIKNYFDNIVRNLTSFKLLLDSLNKGKKKNTDKYENIDYIKKQCENYIELLNIVTTIFVKIGEYMISILDPFKQSNPNQQDYKEEIKEEHQQEMEDNKQYMIDFFNDNYVKVNTSYSAFKKMMVNSEFSIETFQESIDSNLNLINDLNGQLQEDIYSGITPENITNSSRIRGSKKKNSLGFEPQEFEDYMPIIDTLKSNAEFESEINDILKKILQERNTKLNEELRKFLLLIFKIKQLIKDCIDFVQYNKVEDYGYILANMLGRGNFEFEINNIKTFFTNIIFQDISRGKSTNKILYNEFDKTEIDQFINNQKNTEVRDNIINLLNDFNLQDINTINFELSSTTDINDYNIFFQKNTDLINRLLTSLDKNIDKILIDDRRAKQMLERNIAESSRSATKLRRTLEQHKRAQIDEIKQNISSLLEKLLNFTINDSKNYQDFLEKIITSDIITSNNINREKEINEIIKKKINMTFLDQISHDAFTKLIKSSSECNINIKLILQYLNSSNKIDLDKIINLWVNYVTNFQNFRNLKDEITFDCNIRNISNKNGSINFKNQIGTTSTESTEIIDKCKDCFNIIFNENTYFYTEYQGFYQQFKIKKISYDSYSPFISKIEITDQIPKEMDLINLTKTTIAKPIRNVDIKFDDLIFNTTLFDTLFRFYNQQFLTNYIDEINKLEMKVSKEKLLCQYNIETAYNSCLIKIHGLISQTKNLLREIDQQQLDNIQTKAQEYNTIVESVKQSQESYFTLQQQDLNERKRILQQQISETTEKSKKTSKSITKNVKSLFKDATQFQGQIKKEQNNLKNHIENANKVTVNDKLNYLEKKAQGQTTEMAAFEAAKAKAKRTIDSFTKSQKTEEAVDSALKSMGNRKPTSESSVSGGGFFGKKKKIKPEVSNAEKAAVPNELLTAAKDKATQMKSTFESLKQTIEDKADSYRKDTGQSYENFIESVGDISQQFLATQDQAADDINTLLEKFFPQASTKITEKTYPDLLSQCGVIFQSYLEEKKRFQNTRDTNIKVINTNMSKADEKFDSEYRTYTDIKQKSEGNIKFNDDVTFTQTVNLFLIPRKRKINRESEYTIYSIRLPQLDDIPTNANILYSKFNCQFSINLKKSDIIEDGFHLVGNYKDKPDDYQNTAKEDAYNYVNLIDILTVSEKNSSIELFFKTMLGIASVDKIEKNNAYKHYKDLIQKKKTYLVNEIFVEYGFNTGGGGKMKSKKNRGGGRKKVKSKNKNKNKIKRKLQSRKNKKNKFNSKKKKIINKNNTKNNKNNKKNNNKKTKNNKNRKN